MSFTRFKGVTAIGDYSSAEQIKTNLVHFLNWSFLEIGAYFNIYIPQSGAYGGDESRLRMVSDPYYTDGQVWEGFRSNWVWESGVNQSIEPIQVSGVFVDNTFFDVTDGNITVDYLNGRIIFDTAQSSSAVVRAEHSPRWISVYDANDVPWYRQTQYSSQRIDTKFFLTGSGDRHSLAQTRVQLPAIVVEMGNSDSEPYSIGFGHNIYEDVTFHVISQHGPDAERIADILFKQGANTGKTIFGFDLDLVRESGAFPLNYQGAIASGAKTFPELVVPVEDGGFRWTKIRLFNSRKESQQVINQELYIRPVTMTSEVVLALV